MIANDPHINYKTLTFVKTSLMNLLIVAATEKEVRPSLDWLTTKNSSIEVLLTGVGMVATAFAIGKKLREKPFDALLNVGVAGSFSKNCPLGSIFRVHEDCFSELGAEDADRFLPIDSLNLGSSTFQENPGILANLQTVNELSLAKGITVNQVHGNENTILTTRNRFSPDVESMEGAAVFYAAQQAGIHAVQIRSISNIIEKRNKSNWNIPLAIQNLNAWLVDFMEDFLRHTQYT